jgi:hypothetical protein
MIFPNISSLFRWVNNYQPGAPNTSRDFLQLIRQSDGTVLGFIDETGTPRGSLALGSGGVRVLKGAFGTNYVIDSPSSWVDVDGTNLSTTITVPLGYTLVVTVAANVDGGISTTLLGIAVDGSIVNYTDFGAAAGATPVVGNIPAALIASLAGDGNSHVIALQGQGSFNIESNNADGPQIPVMTLVLAPSI